MPGIYWLIAAQRRFLEAMDTMLKPPRAGADLRDSLRQAGGHVSRGRGGAGAQRVARLQPEGEPAHPAGRGDLAIARAGAAVKGPSDGGLAPTQGQQCRIGWPRFCEVELGQPTRTSAHVVKIADATEVLSVHGVPAHEAREGEGAGSLKT